jgi:hypothetical protein
MALSKVSVGLAVLLIITLIGAAIYFNESNSKLNELKENYILLYQQNSDYEEKIINLAENNSELEKANALLSQKISILEEEIGLDKNNTELLNKNNESQTRVDVIQPCIREKIHFYGDFFAFCIPKDEKAYKEVMSINYEIHCNDTIVVGYECTENETRCFKWSIDNSTINEKELCSLSRLEYIKEIESFVLE